VRLRVAVVACGVVVLMAAGCGGGGAPRSVARRYENAILARDGKTLCGTFAPKLREVIGEQLTSERDTAGRHFDCGRFFHLLIGFPHENTDRQFVSGKLLSLGAESRVRRQGVVYAKVPAKLRFEFTYTGYSVNGGKQGEKGSVAVDDIVWLSKKGGTWGVVKPSLALDAASSPDILYQRYSVAHINAAPPDPDYSMNRAERMASERADYRASFHRQYGHAPLRCGGKSVSVADPLHDAVTYPTGSGLEPAPARQANDVARVAVQVTDRRMCVTVTFRKKPAGHVTVGFLPRSHEVFFPEYVVELAPSLGVRGGSLTTGYRYFRGGQRLVRNAVEEISLYGSTVAFVADAGLVHPPSGRVPPDLTWSLLSGARSGSDQVPNSTPGKSLVIRQSDGRTVNPSRG
jgi:hypothetical protein